jgi:hypothetical protein
MNNPDDAYMEGYVACENGQPRDCPNPWSVAWLKEWMRGYDEAAEYYQSRKEDDHHA